MNERLPFTPQEGAAALARLLRDSGQRQADVVRASKGELEKATVSRMLRGERLTWPNVDAFLAALGLDYGALERAVQAGAAGRENGTGRAPSPDPMLQLVADLVRRVGELERQVLALRSAGRRELEEPPERKA